MSKKNSITSMVLGIVGCVLGINGFESYGILAIGGLVCSILALNFSKKALAEVGQNGFNKAGKITGTIGLVFSIIGLVGGIVCAIVICSVGVAGMTMGY